VPAALAEAGGNGKGNNGNGKGNGGSTGEHAANGTGSAAKSEKEKDKQKQKDENNDEGTAAADQAGASAAADQAGASAAGDQAGAPIGAHQVGAPAAAARSGHDFVADELVVANLGGEPRAAIGRLGFAVLDERPLTSLRLTIARLRVPRHMKAPTARTLLASRYPGILIDLNALYRPQGQMILPAPDYPAKLIGWGHAPDRCGGGRAHPPPRYGRRPSNARFVPSGYRPTLIPAGRREYRVDGPWHCHSLDPGRPVFRRRRRTPAQRGAGRGQCF
jgi:hypothetical protein